MLILLHIQYVALKIYVMAMSLEMFMVIQVEKDYPISSQYRIYYYNYANNDLIWN